MEQVFVGAWNAMKPENQGKAIMRVVDMYFKPKKTKKTDEVQVKNIRPTVEKVVGWSALGAEIGIISLAIIKGYALFTKHKSQGDESAAGKVIQVPALVKQDQTKEHAPRHPLLERVAELLADEPFVTMALSGGGFSIIKTVLLDETNGNRVGVTAYGLQDAHGQRQEFRIDVLHGANQAADVFAVTNLEGVTQAEHVQIPLTQFDMQNWPFILPSDSLNTSSLGSEAQWRHVTSETIDALLVALTADIDAANTEKRRNMMNTVSRQMKKKNTTFD